MEKIALSSRSSSFNRVELVAHEVVGRMLAEIMGIPEGRVRLLYLHLETEAYISALGGDTNVFHRRIRFRTGMTNPFGTKHDTAEGEINFLSHRKDEEPNYEPNFASIITSGGKFTWNDSNDFLKAFRIKKPSTK